MSSDWEEVLTLARRANPHYSMSEMAQQLIYEVARTVPEGGLIVELGVCNGKTAVVLACAAEQQGAKYWGIDNWSLEGDIWEVDRLLNGIIPAGAWNRDCWTLTKGDTHAPWAGCEVDLLIIDAGHDEANISKDCEVWIPQLKPGGIVVFDDYPTGPTWKGSCHEAVRIHADKWTGEWELVFAWQGTVARRKPLV